MPAGIDWTDGCALSRLHRKPLILVEEEVVVELKAIGGLAGRLFLPRNPRLILRLVFPVNFVTVFVLHSITAEMRN